MISNPFHHIKSINKSYFFSGLIALVVTAVTLVLFTWLQPGLGKTIKIEHITGSPASKAVFTLDEKGEPVVLDFTKVAAQVMDAVVHIKSTQAAINPNNRNPYEGAPNPFEEFFKNDPFRDFFGPRFFYQQPGPRNQNQPQVRVGQGSGVIISEDG